ncbi:hypothetical protein M569_13925 [Genlisea aurea]|uniref:DUF7796 domain-containing protein n=1 Tax=Genlisea aurea TaxID=192259 RepID=S8C976_9LAMI|nr:hypothetical protein M569_13925 [Genlisea aurea]
MNGAESNRDANNDFSMVLARSRSPLLDFATESPFLHQLTARAPPKLPESPAESDCHQLTAAEVRVSFNETVDWTTVRRKREYEVLSCKLKNLFQRKSIILRWKTKSRLMDPPEENNLKFKSLSKLQGKRANQYNSLADEDLSKEYKKMKLSAFAIMKYPRGVSRPPVLAMSSSGALGGAYCRPCPSPCNGSCTVLEMRAVGEAWGTEDMGICDADGDWEAGWEELFDRAVDQRLATKREEISVSKFRDCVEEFEKMKMRSGYWDGPFPAQIYELGLKIV